MRIRTVLCLLTVLAAGACVGDSGEDGAAQPPPAVTPAWQLDLGAIAATPATTEVPVPSVRISGDVAIAHDGDEVIAVNRADGTRLWSREGVAGPVHLTGSSVVVRDGDHITVLRLDSGAEWNSWRTPGGWTLRGMTLTGLDLYTVEESGSGTRVRAMDPHSGAERWSRDFDGPVEVTTPSPVAPLPPLSGRLVRVAPALAPVLVVNALDDWDGETVTASYLLGAADGTELSELKEPLSPFAARPPWQTSGGMLVLQRWDAESCRLDVEAGIPALKQTHTVSFSGRTEGFEGASCVEPFTTRVDEETVLGHDDQGRPMLADLASGQVRWTAPERGTAAFHAEGVVVYSPDGGGSVGVDVASGQTLWTDETLGCAGGSSAAVGGLALCHRIDDPETLTLVATDLHTGAGVWTMEHAFPAAHDGEFLILNSGVPGDADPSARILAAVPA